jgi:hypothetical protein
VAGILPIAIGTGYAMKQRKLPNVSTVFFGDGAMEEGAAYEALNLASLWKLPVIFVCENNTAEVERKPGGGQYHAPNMAIVELTDLANIMGMKTQIVDGLDLGAVSTVQEEVGLRGAQMIARSLAPDCALVTDVGHATDSPGISHAQHGQFKLAGGPKLAVGGAMQPEVVARLAETAAGLSIPLQRAATPGGSGTDTDALFVATLGGLLVVEGVVGPWAIGFGLIRTLFVLARAARPDAPRAERRSTLGRWIFSVTVVALLAALAMGPGVVSLAVGIGAAGALIGSFAPDYLALFGTKEAP